MARFKGCKDVNFGLTGRMRDIVFRQTKLGIIAAQYNKPAYSKEKANSPVAKIFGTVSRFGFDLRPMVNVGMNDLAINTFTVISQFVKANFRYGSVGVDGLVTIDYKQIVVSVGAGIGLTSLIAEQDALGGLDVKCNVAELTTEEKRAKVYVGVYCPTADRNLGAMGVFSLGQVEIGTGSVKVMMPPKWVGQNVHVYIFTRTDNGLISRSQYVGQVVLD